MESKLKRNIELKDLVLVIIIVLLIIISIILYLKKIELPKQEEKENNIKITSTVHEKQETEVDIPKTDEEIIKYLSTLGERDRMEYYCGEYFKRIKHKDYEKAYNMLYSEFKQNYFPTLEKYTQYIESFYPTYFALNYDDITRQGDIYVLRLKIIDALGNKNDEENIQRIVIKENYYNDFVLSFQVK